eukprot:TCONS_00053835-protein
MFASLRLVNNKLQTICQCQKLQQRTMSYLKAHRKRFYRNVNLEKTDEGFLVQLDGKTIKTPLRFKLCIPQYDLALAVSNEWHMQTNEINPFSMPLTSICNTTIDNPTELPKEDLVKELLQFLHSDTICSLAEMPESLVERQDKEWKPIRDWFSKTFEVEVNASSNLFNLCQSDETVERLEEYLLKMNYWQINGLQSGIDAIKSFILPLAVFHGHISVERAVYLSRLESEYQSEKWGKFEGSHDIDQYTQQAMLAAGTLVCNLCRFDI